MSLRINAISTSAVVTARKTGRYARISSSEGIVEVKAVILKR
jgi:hypothetical protein